MTRTGFTEVISVSCNRTAMRYNVISSATLRKKRLEYSTQTISLHVSPGTGIKRQLKVLKSQSYFAGLKSIRKGLTGLENENKP